MCDRRLNGKPICDTLKLAAACNPYRRYMILRLCNKLINNNFVVFGALLNQFNVYRICCCYRHSDEMLKKLMAAGLGFYDTTKLETIGLLIMFWSIFFLNIDMLSYCRQHKAV